MYVRVVKQNKFGILMKQITNAQLKYNAVYLTRMLQHILSQLKTLNNVQQNAVMLTISKKMLQTQIFVLIHVEQPWKDPISSKLFGTQMVIIFAHNIRQLVGKLMVIFIRNHHQLVITINVFLHVVLMVTMFGMNQHLIIFVLLLQHVIQNNQN